MTDSAHPTEGTGSVASAAPRPVENVYLDDATTHRCPPEGSGVMPCCNRTPFEVPSTDRITDDPERVTCDV